MPKTLIALAMLTALSGIALAQSPPAAPPANGAADQAKPSADPANDQTYKMKDGGMYQPPAQRPASPAMDLGIYGRT